MFDVGYIRRHQKKHIADILDYKHRSPWRGRATLLIRKHQMGRVIENIELNFFSILLFTEFHLIQIPIFHDHIQLSGFSKQDTCLVELSRVQWFFCFVGERGCR
jgi:hypothetical protein